MQPGARGWVEVLEGALLQTDSYSDSFGLTNRSLESLRLTRLHPLSERGRW